MTFVKVLKNSAFFSRYQTKYRRRREGKTDYKARRRLVNQDKTKYNVPKVRFVVRVTNKDIICQLVIAKIVGDQVVCAAHSHELGKHGVKVGWTNYAACYATGLLLARRWLHQLGKDKRFSGVKSVTGKHYLVEGEGEEKPKRCILDIGLRRTTTGARMFGALKGACDGGLHVPHSDKRFPGFDKEKGELDSEKHRQRIFGVHIAQYQNLLLKTDPQKYDTLFSQYKKAGVTPDKIESTWKACHESIRKDPTRAAKKPVKKEHKNYAHARLTTEERQKARLDKKQAMIQSMLQE